jgi:hypothetical protein
LISKPTATTTTTATLLLPPSLLLLLLLERAQTRTPVVLQIQARM